MTTIEITSTTLSENDEDFKNVKIFESIFKRKAPIILPGFLFFGISESEIDYYCFLFLSSDSVISKGAL